MTHRSPAVADLEEALRRRAEAAPDLSHMPRPPDAAELARADSIYAAIADLQADPPDLDLVSISRRLVALEASFLVLAETIESLVDAVVRDLATRGPSPDEDEPPTSAPTPSSH